MFDPIVELIQLQQKYADIAWVDGVVPAINLDSGPNCIKDWMAVVSYTFLRVIDTNAFEFGTVETAKILQHISTGFNPVAVLNNYNRNEIVSMFGSLSWEFYIFDVAQCNFDSRFSKEYQVWKAYQHFVGRIEKTAK